jgi:hypothetical protein
VWPVRAGKDVGKAALQRGTSSDWKETGNEPPNAAHAPSLDLQSARLTLRGKNTATKIENNSKIFGALSGVKEIDLKIE